MLSSLKSYLSTQFFANSTDSQSSEKPAEEAHEAEERIGDVESFVSGLRGIAAYPNILLDIVSLAKVSSKKIADELKSTAKQISEKVCRTYCFLFYCKCRYLPLLHLLSSTALMQTSLHRGRKQRLFQ